MNNDNEVEIDITDEDFLFLAKMAHEQDITFNTLVNNIIKKYLDKIENNPLINLFNKNKYIGELEFKENIDNIINDISTNKVTYYLTDSNCNPYIVIMPIEKYSVLTGHK